MVFLPAAAVRWWRLSQLAPSTPARSHLSREAFGQVIWRRFSLFQLVGGERCWFFSHIMSCFVHVSTGSVLCLHSRLHGEFKNATSRFWFGLSSVFNPCMQTMHSNRNRFLNGEGKQFFLLRTYLQMAFIPSHHAGSEQQLERSKVCSMGGKDTQSQRM